MKKEPFKPKVCNCCTQTTEYAMGLDKGIAYILIAIANAVRNLDRNKVHLVNEMLCDPKDYPDYRSMVEGGHMTLRMIGNAGRARFHGLIAFVERGSGEYLLTSKGAKFLRGERLPKTVIVSKVTGHNIGYFEPHGTISISELLKSKDPFWERALPVETISRIAGEEMPALF